MADFSVAMATYNGEAFLPEQLRSLAQQTRLPRELVICDDASTDATIQVIRDFARTAPFPVRVYENERRLHFADNFLRAMGLCTSTHIALCDQDDVWYPQKLARAAEALERDGVCLVGHNARTIDRRGQPLGHFRHRVAGGRHTGADLHPWGFFYGFTCVFEARILDALPADGRPIDPLDPARRLAHDRWVALLAALCGDIWFLEEDLADYRQHGANASGRMRMFRGYRRSLADARTKFGFHLLKQLVFARQIQAAMSALAEHRTDGGPVSVERLARQRELWSGFEERCAARYAIASLDGIAARARALVQAVAGRAYRDVATDETSYPELAQDALVGLIAYPEQARRAEDLLARIVRPRKALDDAEPADGTRTP